MTPASRRRARSAARSRRRPRNGWRRAGCGTAGSTRRRCARRRVRRCSPAATTTRSGWVASPRSPRRRRATPASAPTRRRRWPRSLKLNGYSTAQFGKCHEVPVYETSPMGPFDAWPTGGGGFEYFYGFIGGETNQWYPAIYEGTTPVEPWGRPGGGLPLHRGHDRPRHRVGASAEVVDAGQAVLHVLRARRDARPAPRAEGLDRALPGPLRRRAGTRCGRRSSSARRRSA